MSRVDVEIYSLRLNTALFALEISEAMDLEIELQLSSFLNHYFSPSYSVLKTRLRDPSIQYSNRLAEAPLAHHTGMKSYLHKFETIDPQTGNLGLVVRVLGWSCAHKAEMKLERFWAEKTNSRQDNRTRIILLFSSLLFFFLPTGISDTKWLVHHNELSL